MKRPMKIFREFTTNVCVLLLGLIFSFVQVGCEARRSQNIADPEWGRSGKQHLVIKKRDVFLNGQRIMVGQTTPAELAVVIGRDISNQGSSDAYWNETGLQIHATPGGIVPGGLKRIQQFVAWVRQSDNSSKRRDCNDDELKRHQISINERIEMIERSDLKHGWGSRSELKDRVRGERCSVSGKSPEHVFVGYVEVDGLLIRPNMSLQEIQVRRKQLGLEPLYQNSGPMLYVAPRGKTGLEIDQTWIFDVTTGDRGVVVDQRLKAIRIP